MSNSLKIFNTIEFVTNSPGFVLLFNMMKEVFFRSFTDFVPVGVTFIAHTEAFIEPLKNKFAKNEKKFGLTLRTIEKPKLSTENVNFEKIIDYKTSVNEDLSQTLNFSECSAELTPFSESKNTLLGKFFSKMTQEKPEISEICEKIEPQLEEKYFFEPNFIKIKNSRSDSITPRSQSSKQESEKKLFQEFAFNPNSFKKIHRAQESKIKKIIIGTRFYKKIDEKFLELLSEKMKKDLARLKQSSPQTYLQKKAQNIQENKAKWVDEAISDLKSSKSLFPNNENDSHLQVKNEALLEYLRHEKTLSLLISKAESLYKKQ